MHGGRVAGARRRVRAKPASSTSPRSPGSRPATVSRSLRGPSNVSPQTRQRVLDAARELAYTVSPHASGLASGRTGAVGVVVPVRDAMVLRQRHRRRCTTRSPPPATTCCSTTWATSPPATGSSSACRWPAASTPCVSVAMPLSEEHTLALRALDMPMVTVGARIPGVPGVGIDDELACRTAVHHLVHQGHERIAMIAGVDDDGGFGFVSSHRRRAGYLGAMAAAGLKTARARRGRVTASRPARRRWRRSSAGRAAADRRRRRVRRAGHRRDAGAAPRQRRRARAGVGRSAWTTTRWPPSSTSRPSPSRCASRESRPAGCSPPRSTAGSRVTGDVVLPTRLVVRGSTGVPVDPRRSTT